MQTLTASKYDLPFDERVMVVEPSKEFPLLVRPKDEIEFSAWAMENREEINQLLLQHGAILFRGFKIGGSKAFSNSFRIVVGEEAMEYKNRTSPREKVYNNVYTSTSHPKDLMIHMHTENSYSKVYNRIISFYCLTPPDEAGQTPIADERKIPEVLDPAVVEKFRTHGVLYTRNSMPGVGLDWKVIFQTDDKEKVNSYLQANNYDFEWVNDNHLRLRWVLPAFQVHPVTGEEMWFNHMYFGHKGLYHPSVIEFFEEEDLPFATYYGDGSEIEEEVLTQLQAYYKNNAIVYDWQKDDFLLLDNMMYSHGRMPFKGKRKILTAMGHPYDMIG